MPTSETMTLVGAASAAVDVLNALPIEELPQLVSFHAGAYSGRPTVECQLGDASHGPLATSVRALLAWHEALNALSVAALDAAPQEQKRISYGDGCWFVRARMLIEPADVWLSVWALLTAPAEIDAAMRATIDPERAADALVAGALGGGPK